MSNQQVAPLQPKNKALSSLAARLNINEQEVQGIVMRTLVSAKGNQQPTAEEFVTFLAIANEYKLNPLTKEIYAFSNRGTIQPIVSIDGWLATINGHPQFDGMEFIDSTDANGNLISVTCSIYRKDRSRATQVTEYMNECADKSGKSEPWKRWPARMLRHKAAIQAARYAFGLSGIYDPDEADRIQSVKDVTPSCIEKSDDLSGAHEAYLAAIDAIDTPSKLEEARLKTIAKYGTSSKVPSVISNKFAEKMLELSNDNSL